MNNDTWIALVNEVPDDIRGEVLAELLPLAVDAVRLEIPLEEKGETWMVDGDYFDAVVIVVPAESEPIACDFDSHDWPDDFRKEIAKAKDAYYAAQREGFDAATDCFNPRPRMAGDPNEETKYDDDPDPEDF